MEIKIAEHCGFCYGVKRAVGLALTEAERTGRAATLGSLIHNPQMIEELAQKGVACKNSLDDFVSGEKVIFRSHGESPEIYQQAKERNLQIIDATCPNVRMSHQKVEKAVKDGYLPIIIGEKNHQEVKSLKKWSGNDSFVVECKDDIAKIPVAEKYAVIVQTTFERGKFLQLVELLQKEKPGEYRIEETICDATSQRQAAAVKLAKEMDAMIVIGGHNSANTKHLTELVSKYCDKVIQIETASELRANFFGGCKKIGITAGASTPDRLIKEAYILMENLENKENFETLLEESMEGGVKVYSGNIVEGEVIQKDKEGIYVAFGYMREGFIPYSEWSVTQSPEELMETVQIGDRVEAKIVMKNGKDEFIRMSKLKADREVAWKNVAPLAEGEKRPATVKVLRMVKGKGKNVVGLSVAVENVEGFMPASLVELKRVEDFTPYIGKELNAEIIEVDLEKHRVVVSRKDMLKAEKAAKKKEREERIAAAKEAKAAAAAAAMELIEEGMIVVGKVKKVVEFGLFVEIAKDLVGLVHITELGWKKGLKPEKVAKVGDEVNVMIKKIDKENQRVALSIKDTTEDPWKAEASQLNIGDVVIGKVVKFMSFGAIVKLSEKVEGMVHISEISEERVAKPEDVLQIGQDVTVAVIKMNLDDKKIGLSIVKAKQAAEEAGYENYMGKEDNTLTSDLAEKFEK